MAGRFQADHYLAWHRPQTFEKPAELVEASPIHGKAHLTDDPLRVRVICRRLVTALARIDTHGHMHHAATSSSPC
jgi:hypothetical protein